MKYYEYKTVLPTELKSAIDAINFTNIQRNKAFKLIDILYTKIQTEYWLEDYLPLSKKYFIKVFNDGRYCLWFKKLVTASILIPKLTEQGQLEAFIGKSAAYKINPDLLTVNLTTVSINTKTDTERINIAGEQWTKEFINQELSNLIIDGDKLMQAANDAVNKMAEKDLILDDKIDVTGAIEVHNLIKRDKYYTSIFKAISYAKLHKTHLIEYKGKFYISDTDTFIATRKRNLLYRYSNSINRLTKRYYTINRNQTNNRLDHNLTTLGKPILDIIKADNALVEIDLSNSQWTILANAMEQDANFIPDEQFNQYLYHATSGTLYEFLATELGKSRIEAKKVMMQIGFSSHKKLSEEKTMFTKHFPSVSKYINDKKMDYEKRKMRKGSFSIELQKFESNLFIDHFYYELKKKGLWVITKHDSLLVKKENVTEILEIIKQCSLKLNFKGTFKSKTVKNNTTTMTAKVINMKEEQFFDLTENQTTEFNNLVDLFGKEEGSRIFKKKLEYIKLEIEINNRYKSLLNIIPQEAKQAVYLKHDEIINPYKKVK